MDIMQIFHGAMGYIQNNPVGAAAVAFVLLVLLYRRPKTFFVLIGIAVAIVGVLALFDKLSITMHTNTISFLK